MLELKAQTQRSRDRDLPLDLDLDLDLVRDRDLDLEAVSELEPVDDECRFFLGFDLDFFLRSREVER